MIHTEAKGLQAKKQVWHQQGKFRQYGIPGLLGGHNQLHLHSNFSA